MIKLDEDALICDLAEVYHIFDYKQLPAYRVAVFSLGLSDSSRIKLKLTDRTVDFETMLLAGIFDKVSMLFWSKTKDAEKNKNRPTSVVEMLNGKQENQSKVVSFESGKDFEANRQRILDRGKGGN